MEGNGEPRHFPLFGGSDGLSEFDGVAKLQRVVAQVTTAAEARSPVFNTITSPTAELPCSIFFDFRRIRIEPVVEIRGAINDEEIPGVHVLVLAHIDLNIRTGFRKPAVRNPQAAGVTRSSR